MTNTYRVDRQDSKRVPCGMNSIRYIGTSLSEATNVFDSLQPRKDSWDREDANYGVVLSKWNSEKNDYVIVKCKGLELNP